jgi:hypothetical protein
VENFVDLYTDYLITSSSYTTATGMASLLGISHDKITRHLNKDTYDSEFLWQYVKPFVNELVACKEPIILSLDDSIEEKKYSDESELINWHFDHTFGRSVKGVNFLTALLEIDGMRLPCCVEYVIKDKWETNQKTNKPKRKSDVTKNELFRKMIKHCKNNFRFDYVVADSWYSSVDNMKLIKQELKSNFIIALKSNRKVALTKDKKETKEYINIDSLQPGQQTVEVWLEELDFPLLLVKQVFKDGDDTVGELYLACSDLNLSYSEISTIYKKRWGVEEYHKSIKSNTNFAKSPTKNVKTQTNHFTLSIIAYVKLEWLKQRTQTNHFGLKAKIYLVAQKAANIELLKLKNPLAA